MVSVPLREAPELAATLNCTVPLPEPLAPDVTVIHESLLAAVQPHPAGAVTPTALPVAAPLPTDWFVGLIEDVQFPACVTVKVWPPTVSVPVRAGPALAATLNPTLPPPCR